MNVFFYQTKTQYSNTGDALINNALIQLLRKYGKLYANCSIDTPDEFLRELNIRNDEAIHCKNNKDFAIFIFRYATKHRGNNIYIVSGLGDMYGGGLKKVSRNLISSCVLPIYRLAGVKIIRIGRSFGLLTKSMQFSEWLRSLFVNYYFVRDRFSLEQCKNMHIHKAKLCPDMSWIYNTNKERMENAKNTVIVNMKSSTHDLMEQTYMDAIVFKCEQFIELVRRITKSDPLVIITYQVEQDYKFSEFIYSRLKVKCNTLFVREQLKLSNLEGIYNQGGYHLSNRMHSLLSGYKYGSLPVAIINTKDHFKINATFEDCGLQELVIDVFDSNPESQMINIINSKSELYKKVILCERRQSDNIIKCLNQILE